ncbi:hypothetical protein LAZ40_00760 [Cereibacter sphaeroides]|uniref:hypothetical protein n=1 Tax=Cereibacter sphaeroides TaxID=1063 RepID=UPI001F1E2BDD|nr:hypothetical protein [Cereibacter sphaeroides]MCE6957602.1 hypothetical protein [Cereibacter sphaeroides]MCE6971305.1 hypothetical protein [Cereibacter sphaeroides]
MPEQLPFPANRALTPGRGASTPSRPNTVARPLAGWAFEAAVRLEARAERRLIGPLMDASPWRRAVVFAALAASADPRRPRDPLADRAPADLVPWLLAGRMETIVDATFGPIPGLLRLIQRSGPEPFEDPRAYRLLARLLRLPGPRTRRAVRLLRRMPTLTMRDVMAVRLLPGELLSPGIVREVTSVEHAREIADIWRLLRRHTDLSPEAHRREMEGLNVARCDRLAMTLLQRHGKRLAPFEDDEHFEFLRNGPQFLDYRKIRMFHPPIEVARCAVGNTALARYRHGPYLVQLLCLTDGAGSDIETRSWFLADTHGIGCDRASGETLREIQGHLRARGILTLGLSHVPSTPARFARRYASALDTLEIYQAI